MCLILRGRVENLLVLDLEYAELSNRDGFGVHTPNGVLYSFDHKGKRGRGIRATLETLGRDTMATIHFRLATHGGVSKANAHPFDIGSNTFLMHNGMLRGAEYDCPLKLHSDTALLSFSLVGKPHKERCALLTSLAVSNRFCLLRGSKWRKFGQWFFDDATCTWHSNRLILPASFGKRDSSCCDPRTWEFEDYFTDSDLRYFSSKKSSKKSKPVASKIIDRDNEFCDACQTFIPFDEPISIVNGFTYCEACDDAYNHHHDSLNVDDFTRF